MEQVEIAMDKYQYRIPSARCQNWDYRWNGAYFITICTQNRVHYFGEVHSGKMILSNVGVIADILWHEIKLHAKNIELGEFVVMPNHVHGILILTGDVCDDIAPVETGHALSLQSPSPQSPSPQSPPPQPSSPTQLPPTIGHQRFQNPGKNSVSSIIGSYKSAVTRHAHRLGFEFAWQSRFHDHIIRDDGEFQRISNYIYRNPQTWENDKFNSNDPGH